jgi:hypothetical protein
VRGCGKTTLLKLLEYLSAEPFRNDDVSPAAIYYHLADNPDTCLLVDEADNAGLFERRSQLRTLFNSGHERGGSFSRYISGWSRRFSTFAPLCVAGIGTLPLPLMQRSVMIRMQRRPPGEYSSLDESDPSFAAAREQIRRWASSASLASNPQMPASIYNRVADNWRVLFSIADDLGHGEEARAAAIELSSNRPDEDVGVTLLRDIQTILFMLGADRITSAALIERLVELADGFWGEWRGPNDDRPPRKLSQSELARLLQPFEIRSRTIRPRPGDRTARGYHRHQFEAAWAAYCPADTPPQSNNVRYLTAG